MQKTQKQRWKIHQERAVQKLNVARCLVRKKDREPCPACAAQCVYSAPGQVRRLL